MATNIPKAPSNKKGEPPKIEETKGNLSSSKDEELVYLTFRVTQKYRQEFKLTAVTHGITQTELFKQAIAEWREKHE